MADTQSKIDAAAEKAFSAAAEKKSADAVSAKAIETAVAADKTPPVKASAIADAVAAPAKPAATKPRLKKKAKIAKSARKPVAAKIAATPRPAANAISDTPSKLPTISQLKDKIMDTAKTNTADYASTATGAAKDAVAQIQTRAKAAYEKGTEVSSDVAAFTKGNMEAMVESGKILAAGMQDMGRGYVETAKAAAETVQDDVKKMAAVKSPTEFFQLQGEIVRRNFDAAVAQTSKNAEAMMKLANEAFAPISNRASIATEKFSKAA